MIQTTSQTTLEDMSNEQLVAVILNKNLDNENHKEVVDEALKAYGRVNNYGMSVKDAKRECPRDISQPVKRIEASVLLAQRFKDKQIIEDEFEPQNIWEMLSDLRGEYKEHFIVFYLNSRDQELKRELVSLGTVNASLVHPREVFKSAIEASAVDILFAHNHPSDKTDPSDQDISVTRRLSEAGDLLGIKVKDHVIVSRSGYYSFKEHDMIDY